MATAETQNTSTCETWGISTTVREEAEVAQTVRAAMTMWQEVNDGLRDFAEARKQNMLKFFQGPPPQTFFYVLIPTPPATARPRGPRKRARAMSHSHRK